MYISGALQHSLWLGNGNGEPVKWERIGREQGTTAAQRIKRERIGWEQGTTAAQRIKRERIGWEQGTTAAQRINGNLDRRNVVVFYKSSDSAAVRFIPLTV